MPKPEQGNLSTDSGRIAEMTWIVREVDAMPGDIVAETERLILREFSPDDAEGFFEMNADPLVLRYTGDAPFRDVAEARAFLAAYDAYDRSGFGRWSVYERGTGQYVGFCGLNHRPETDEVDLGFRFRQSCWGRGYATEAGAAALRIGFEQYGLHRIVGRAMRDNPASHRVLAKLGMTRTCEFVQDGETWIEFERIADAR